MAGILAEAVRPACSTPRGGRCRNHRSSSRSCSPIRVPFPAELRDLVERSITMWVALIGTITFELFGHLHKTVSDYRGYFDRAMVVAAEAVGLDIDLVPPT